MAVIVEQLSGDGAVLARWPLAVGACLRMGRAYDNDVIVADRHADPFHAELRMEDDGRVHLRDNGSVNGVYVDKHKINSASVVRVGGAMVLGKTRFRLVDPAVAAVTAALPISPSSARALSHPVSLFILAAFVAAVTTAAMHYLSIGNDSASLYVVSVLLAFVALSGYAGCWAVISKLRRGEARFLMQGAVAMLFYLLLTAWSLLAHILEFNYSALPGFYPAGVAVLTALLFALFFLNVRLSTRFSGIKSSLLVALPLILFGGLVYLLAQSAKDEFSPRPDYSPALLPPAYQFAEPPPRAFIESAATVFNPQ